MLHSRNRDTRACTGLTDPPRAASPEMRGAADPLDMKAEAVRGFSCTNDLCGLPAGPSSDPPAGYHPGQRWKGVIENAIIEGVMLPSSITAMAVFAGADRQHWLPFDWKTVKQLQEAVMKYDGQ